MNSDDETEIRNEIQASTEPQDFRIIIKVLSARLDGNNINPKCLVKCADQEKSTKAIRSTNNPSWNETFFFNFKKLPSDLFDKMIEFHVTSASGLVKTSIGSFKIEIGYVYNEPIHSILYKWVFLSDKDDFMSGANGYLKVSIHVIGPGDEDLVKKKFLFQ